MGLWANNCGIDAIVPGDETGVSGPIFEVEIPLDWLDECGEDGSRCDPSDDSDSPPGLRGSRNSSVPLA